MRRSTSITPTSRQNRQRHTPAFREQAITDAQLARYADHEVDPVTLHFEDPIDRLRREEPDAIDLAAGHRRLEGATERALPWPLPAPMSARRQPSVQVVSGGHDRVAHRLERHAVAVQLHRRPAPAATGGGTTLATRWNSKGDRPMWKSAPTAPQCARQRTHPGAGR